MALGAKLVRRTTSRASLDLRTRDGVRAAFRKPRPQIVIHAAAKVGGIGANMDSPADFIRENSLMSLHMVEAAREYGVEKFVGIGSVCMYPAWTRTPFIEEDLWRGFPEETNAPYGIAKRHLLTLLKAYHKQHGLKSTFVVPVNMYGPGDNIDPRNSHVIPALIRKFLEAQAKHDPTIPLWGDGTATREFLYVDDAVEGILLAAEKISYPFPINLGPLREISIRDLAALIAQLMQFPSQVAWNTEMPNGQKQRAVSVSRAREHLGWEAKMPLEKGLEITISDLTKRLAHSI